MNLKSLLFNFQGRIGRGPFWIGTLILIAFEVVMMTLVITIGGGQAASGPNAIGIVLLLVYVVFGIWMGLAVDIKRCHDRGQSGWWILIMLIPLVGFFWWLINLGILAGDEGENRFGPNPEAKQE